MNKMSISTGKAPKAIGPYSQAVRLGDVLYTSGQLPMHPDSGDIVGSSAAEQAEQCLANLKAVLQAGSSSMDRVVKTLIFLTDINDFARANEIYKGYFTSDYPARTTVQVAKLPTGIHVEVEMIAACRDQ